METSETDSRFSPSVDGTGPTAAVWMASRIGCCGTALPVITAQPAPSMVNSRRVGVHSTPYVCHLDMSIFLYAWIWEFVLPQCEVAMVPIEFGPSLKSTSGGQPVVGQSSRQCSMLEFVRSNFARTTYLPYFCESE